MDIFGFAMEFEKSGEQLYRELASSAGSEGMRSIFNMLAAEEVKHLQIIKAMKKGTPGSVDSKSDVLSNARGIFKVISGSEEDIAFTDDQVEAYKKARDFEKKTMEFYQFKRNEEFEADQKYIFERLAQEEKKHYHLLDSIVEFTASPGRWLEDAEFNHLEDY